MNIIAHCTAKVIIVITTGVAPMNEIDWRNLEAARHHCVRHHSPANPCLKKLYKMGVQNYLATCGPEDK